MFGSKQEKQRAQTEAPQLLKIVEDCTRLVNTTEKPDVFFDRYALLLEKTLEQYTQKRPAAVSDFIERYHARVVIDAAGKSTDKGKRAQFDKFLAEMQSRDLTPEQMRRVEDLHAADVKNL